MKLSGSIMCLRGYKECVKGALRSINGYTMQLLLLFIALGIAYPLKLRRCPLIAKKIGFVECNRNIGMREVEGKTYDGLTFKLVK